VGYHRKFERDIATDAVGDKVIDLGMYLLQYCVYRLISDQIILSADAF
jgi:hypothetical protein